MSWTDERVAILKKLWTDGLSASQIALKLGNVSRNAVIGKVHRLGLSGRATTSRMRSVRPRARVVAFPGRTPSVQYRSHGNAALKALFLPAALPVPEPVLDDIEIPMADRVDLLSLKDCMCRWPLGDPQDETFRFCGRRTQDGASYCEHHARIAYQPVQRRRRQVLEFA
jgi:Global cell cycle regulator GcrA